MSGAPEVDKSELGQAWDGLLAALGDARAQIDRWAVTDLDRAEGYRFLMRLLGAGADMHVENWDVRHPFFTRVMTETRKLLGDNPDTFYDIARISGELSYRVSGDIGETCYMGICVYAQMGTSGAPLESPQGPLASMAANAAGGRGNRIVANVAMNELKLSPDGRFEVIVSKKRPQDDVDWLQIDEDAHSLLVRQYFHDRPNQRHSKFEIECLEAESEISTDPLSKQAMATRIDTFSNWIRGVPTITGMTGGFLRSRPNEITVNRRGAEQGAGATLYPTPDNYYSGGWFKLGPDEALIMEGVPPKTHYWGIQLLNEWMESLDYRYKRVHYNLSNTKLESDGSFRFVVAHHDPGHPNWLDTDGHEVGYLLFRWMQAEMPTPPRLEVVPFEEIPR